MPWYDYECRACGHVFTLNRSVDERDRPCTCPECHGSDVRRAMSTFLTVTGGGEGGAACSGGG